MKRLKILLSMASALSFSLVAAQSQHYILALSKANKKLVVLHYKTLDTIAQVNVGEDPHEVVTSEDGALAYVANTVNGTGHEINIIDLKTFKPVKNIDTRPLYGPHGLVYMNGQLWFTAQGSKAVGIYNVKDDKLDWAMGTGQNITHLLYVTPDAQHFYTTNVESGTVSIFDHVLLEPAVPPTGVLPPGAKPRWDWVQTLVPAGKGAEGFDVSPNGKELWTAKPDGYVAVIDLDKRKVADDINTGILGLHRIKFTPDGSYVCVVSVRTGDLLFYDAGTRKAVKKINIGRGAAMLMDKESNRLFISCTPDHYVAVIDLAKMEMVKKLEIGGRPDGLTVAEVK